jgi:hypothetical protein
MEMDARGLYFANETGEETLDIPGLWVLGAMNCPGKESPCTAWLLEADEVGKGGENGSGGYCDAWRLIEEDGEIEGGGWSSSPPETPRARSWASCNSATYFSQAMAILANLSHGQMI